MLWQRYTNSKIADIRYDLANRRMVMAEAAFAHAQIAWPKEKAMVDETMALVKATPQYNLALVSASAVESSWLRTDAEFDRMTSKLGIPVTQEDDLRTSRGMAIAITDLMANTMRNQEARAIALNDRRFSRQLSVLAVGHNKLAPAVKIGRLAGLSADAVRNAFTSAVDIGMNVWGYEDNRIVGQTYAGWKERNQGQQRYAPIEDRSFDTSAQATEPVEWTKTQVASESPPI